MHGVSRKLLVSFTIVVSILVVSSMAIVWMMQRATRTDLKPGEVSTPLTQGEANVSLRHLIDHPEEYLGERFALFTVVKLVLREDPYHRLIEIYYLVHIKDSYEYEASFVISSDQYSNYAARIGERVLFKLLGALGPGIVAPPDRLITNILVSKSADPYAREFYTIRITMADRWLTPLLQTIWELEERYQNSTLRES